MVLRKIKASGVKGQAFEYELSPATAIVGPNFGGKTAILEAVKFICRGKFPEVKKGEWPELSVTGTFSDDSIVIRAINAKGTVKTSYVGPVTIGVGPEPPERFDVPLMDPGYYFGLSDRERTNYVFERVKLPDTYSGESISAEITRLNLGREHSEAVEKAKGDVISELRDLFVNRPADMTLQEALAEAVEKCRTRFTYWNRRCKETQGAVTTLTELKLREKNFTAAPANLDTEIKELESKAAEANRLLGQLRQALDETEQSVARRKSFEEWLAEDRIDYPRMLEQVRGKRNKLAHEFERLNDSIIAIDIGGLKSDLADAEAHHKKAEQDLTKVQHAADEAEQALKDLESQTECPYCRSNHKTWKESVRFLLEKKMSEAEGSVQAQSGIVASGKARIADLGKQINDFVSIKLQAETKRLELKRLGDEIDRVLADQDRDEKKRQDWTERLATLTPADPAAVAALKGKITWFETDLKEVNTALQLMNERRTAETKLKQDVARAAEAAHEHDLAAAQLLVTKRVGKLLDEKREAMVSEVFQKLLATANVFTTGILKSPLVLQDNMIGRFEKATFISHHWFSETEKILAYSAIAVALSADAPFKLVLIDEFGRLDERNQEAVTKRLVAMLGDGVIDQFVVAGTQFPLVIPNLKVIDLYAS